MQRLQNTYTTGVPARPSAAEWQTEISGGMADVPFDGTPAMQQTRTGTASVSPDGQRMPLGTMPGMRTGLPDEVIQNPISVEEAHKGSIKAMLSRNEGAYVVATFLVGTQGTVSWEGILHDVGNDFITIYQPGRERYIVIDIYSLKYIEFYDTRRREQCETMMQENGWKTQY